MDRDLLFGVIAVQLGQATPQQVMAAASAYVADKSRGVPARLRSDGVLDDERLAMLEGMVDEALKVHGGDVSQTMQSLGGDRVLFASFGGSLVQDEKGKVTILPEAGRTGDSVEDADAVTLEQAGRYRVTGEEIGRGGIGRVLIAFDEHLGREIAVKELLADTTGSVPKSERSDAVSKTGAIAARFLREARVTGQLEHPNIMPVYELGRRDTGELYYTMKLVRGRTLADALSECRTLTQRLELLSHFVDLCNAIAYAHSRGIIHRDIKTENVMLGEFGETVVLDWGLAKVKGKKDIRGSELERGLELLQDESAGKTVDGSAIGTPAYMSPEQADGAIDEIDARSDVWSLGAVLYELLTGKPPFEGTTPFEIIGKVMKDSVVPPKERNDAVPAELSAVAAKALNREREDRYESARELATEIRAYMSGGRIRAYDYTAWELLRGFVARHKALSAAIGVIVLLVIGSSIALLRAYQQAGTERDRAEQSEQTAKQSESEARQSELRASFTLALALRDNADRLLGQGNALGARIYAAASLVHNPHNPKSPFRRADVPFADPRGEELFVGAYSIFHQATLDATVRPVGVLRHEVPLRGADFSADGAQLATAGVGPEITIWEVAQQKKLRTIPTDAKAVYSLDFSSDGRLLAAGETSGAVRLYDAHDFSLIERFVWQDEMVRWLGFSPDAARLFVAFEGGRVVQWDLAAKDLREISAKKSGFTGRLAISWDNQLMALNGSVTGQVQLWDLVRQSRGASIDVGTGVDAGRRIRGMQFSPDRRLLAVAMQPHHMVMWDLERSRIRARLFAHTESIAGMRFLPEAPYLVSASSDSTARLWSTETFRATHLLAGHHDDLRGVAVAPRGGLIATVSEDRTARLWQLQSDVPAPIMANGKDVFYAEYSPDGSRLAVMGLAPELLDGATRAVIRGFEPGAQAEFSPDGAVLATSEFEGAIRLRDGVTGEERAVLEGHGSESPRHLAFSPDGKTLASGDWMGKVNVWDVGSGRARYKLQGGRGVAFSPDGKVLATSYGPTDLRLWSAATGEPLRTLKGHTDNVDDITFSHDGRWLASSDLAGGVRLWDVERDYQSHALAGHSAWVNSVHFSPDDKLLISGADDWQARIWSVATKQTVLVVKTPSACMGTPFSPDGKHVVLDWGSAVRFFPIDLSIRDADPKELLATAEREASLKLEGVSLLPAE